MREGAKRRVTKKVEGGRDGVERMKCNIINERIINIGVEFQESPVINRWMTFLLSLSLSPSCASISADL